MNIPTLLQQVVNGLGLGVVYALVALAFNLQFGVLRILNLAFGELLVLSAFAALAMQALQPGIFIPVLAGIAAATLGGVLIHVIAVRPLGNVSEVDSPRHLAALISTLGSALVIQNGLLLAVGPYPRRAAGLFSTGRLTISGVELPYALLVDLLVMATVTVSLRTFLMRTHHGLRIRAIASNRELARSIGIASEKDEFSAVVLSSCLAGLAGVLAAWTVGSISPFIGVGYGFKGLVVVIVGGLGSSSGVASVGLLLGVAEALTVGVFGSTYRDAIAFGLLLFFLLARATRRN